MKIIFMGTPTFAIPSLDAIFKSEHELLMVVSQPDKPNGRGNKILHTPTKEYCMTNNIPIAQPEKIRNAEFEEFIKSLNPDVIVTCAYGKIFPESIINIPKYGIVNVHGSLLPKLRGAAPIQWSLINGDTRTGITTMLTNKGVDTGPMLLTKEIELDNKIKFDELYEKLSHVGADVLIETLGLLENNKIKPIEQNHSESTHAPMLHKEMGVIDWNHPADKIHNLVRGLYNNVGTFTHINGTKIKVLDTSCSNVLLNNKNGTIVEINKNYISIKTENGVLNIHQAINSNGKLISDWKNLFIGGKKIEVGDNVK